MVKKGKFKGSTDVAVKTMNTGTMREDDFIDEARTMMLVLSVFWLTSKCRANVCSLSFVSFVIGKVVITLRLFIKCLVLQAISTQASYPALWSLHKISTYIYRVGIHGKRFVIRRLKPY